MPTITRTTRLPAPAAAVWRSAPTLAGINREMRPWLTMHAPPELDGVSLDDERVVLGEPLFSSPVRLFGLVPVDRMAVTLVELDRGRRFVEESPMRSMRRWRHERTVEPDGAGCRVTDTVTFEPLVAAAAPLVRRAVAAFFAHRHRQLVRHFSIQPIPASSPT
jgi:ligand-binding SRPBCC domain-containing protein